MSATICRRANATSETADRENCVEPMDSRGPLLRNTHQPDNPKMTAKIEKNGSLNTDPTEDYEFFTPMI